MNTNIALRENRLGMANFLPRLSHVVTDHVTWERYIAYDKEAFICDQITMTIVKPDYQLFQYIHVLYIDPDVNHEAV